MTQASDTARGRVRHAEVTRRILVTFLDVYNEPGTGFRERHALNCQPSRRQLSDNGLLTASRADR
jgi:hypothetical protein